jgi:hypothetical protein
MFGGKHSSGILLMTAFCCAMLSMITKDGTPALIGCILFAFSASLNARDNGKKK